jgi:MEMO1 family protein
MLRDTQGVAPTHAVLPVELVPIVARFTGASTCAEIAAEASKELGERVPVDLVVRLATELEEGLFVDGPPYRRERARIEREFADASVRAASHAGGAYHGDAQKLAEYIDKECFGRTSRANGSNGSNGSQSANGSKSANGANGAKSANGANGANGAKSANGILHTANGFPGGGAGRLLGLVAPHIDPWRGARCYGEAYGVLAQALPADADTFVLFGTSHAPMREPFSLCRKAFDTPLGRMEADTESIDAIAAACDFDPYADQFNHKREHSLEFQAVFLRHLLGDRPARIIPVLAGLGAEQSSGQSPRHSSAVDRFLGAVRKVVDEKRAVVIAGADLAHVGPRFGDPRAFDEGERRALDETDRESLDHAVRGDAEGFWSHVSGDLDTRRVCGLAPIYALLRTIAPGSEGHLRHYEQNVDPDEGSIVSHAALGFYG